MKTTCFFLSWAEPARDCRHLVPGPGACCRARRSHRPAAEAAPGSAPALLPQPPRAPAAVAEAPRPVPNKGDTAWMMVATILVILMVLPGLAPVLWRPGAQQEHAVRARRSWSRSADHGAVVHLWLQPGVHRRQRFIGGFDRLFMKGIWDNAVGTFANAATFSKGVVIPEISFAAFQATFAGITCALIVGAFAERIKFSAVLLFMVLWFTFSYLPVAHMVVLMGPDAYTAGRAE